MVINIDLSSWEQTARDRTTWRGTTRRDTAHFQEKRMKNEEERRGRRKEQCEKLRPPPTNIIYT